MEQSLPSIFSILYRKSAPTNIKDFISRSFVYNIIDHSNDPKHFAQLDNKIFFRRTLEAEGLPVIRELFRVLASGEVHDANGASMERDEAERTLRAHNAAVFVKPIGGSHGRGAFILPKGAALEPLFSSRTDCLVQPLLSQHPVLSELNPHTVNSIRIDTFRQGGHFASNGAVLKIGRAGLVADNGNQGALVAAIELETGKVHGPARQKAKFGHAVLDAHPETGVRFSEVTIPFWSEVRATIEKAAALFPDLRSIGWDVAITPEGPVLIEGNRRWSPDLFQRSGTGLAPTPIGQAALHLHRTGGAKA